MLETAKRLFGTRVIMVDRRVLLITALIIVIFYQSGMPNTRTITEIIVGDQCKTVKGPIDKDTLIQNVNNLIYRYVNLPIDYTWGSGAIPIAVAGIISSGNILELGTGLYSTNVLHKIGI
jgi:hypothetical protein